MAYDPTKPVDHSQIVAAELRAQFSGLKALIDAQQAQINALQAQLNAAARNPGLGELDPGLHDPPTFADVESIRVYINQLNAGLNW